jgi:hypothetical protein
VTSPIATAIRTSRTITRLRSRLRGIRDRLNGEPSLAARARSIIQEQRSRGEPALHCPQGEFPSGSWQLIGGNGCGWQADLFYKVRGLAWHRDTLYASLTGPTQEGPRGEVWALTGESWRKIGGGIGNSWPAEPAFIDHITIFNDELFAAVAGRLWHYAGGSWSDAAGPLPISGKSGPYAFLPFEGRLAVSVWGDPAVLFFDGKSCERVAEPPGGWGQGARTVYCLAEFEGQLYAGTGTGKFTGPSSSVFRFDGKGWEKIGGDGVRDSWSQPGIPFVLSLTVYGRHLIATLSRPKGTPDAASNVWAFDGEAWQPVAFGRTPSAMAQSLIMNDAIVHDGHLIVATGDSARRDARVWTLDSAQHWQDISGHSLAAGSDARTGGCWIYRLCSDGVSLYAATAGHQGAACVFRWTPIA